MITWIWIEGEKALNDFCERRFKEKPRWMENTGRLPRAKVAQIYKYVYKEDGETVVRVAQMYLLWMDAPNERCKNLAGSGQLPAIQRMSYEEIKTDRTAILRK